MTFMEIINPVKQEFDQIFASESEKKEPVVPIIEFDDTSVSYPKVDILENKDEFILRAEVPGFQKEELDVVFHNGLLTLKAQRTPREEPNEKMLYKERFTGNFIRKFQLSKEIQKDALRAAYRDGVLEIHLPKKPIQEKEIKIQ